MGLRILRFALLPFVVLFALTPVLAADATITVDSVGGRTVRNGAVNKSLSGRALVTGTFAPSSAESTTATPKPLVADAGNSGFGSDGAAITLLGAGYGGTEPYTFQWSSPAGTIEGADAPTAQWLTAGVAPGTYTLGLTVTDAGGTQASDTVKVVVYEGDPQTLLDQTKQDTTPGTLLTGETVEFPFIVPAGTSSITVDASWTVPANDYDLRVLDPNGVERDSSGEISGIPEHADVANPEPGTWTAVLDKYATTVDTIHVVVKGIVATADPRPAVDAGGPYRVTPGTAVSLSGTVSGGTAPYTTGWDTDLDGVLDVAGTTGTVTLPEGRHLITFKATDANGFERREMVSVLVAPAERLNEETTALTVIGVADTGINPYHLEFAAETYPDPDVLALTDNFTRHPSDYIAGYPQDAEALPITLGQGWFPDADQDIWTTQRIRGGKLYWIPGTKIIGAIDADSSTGVTSSADPHPILDDNGHGSGSASVSAGNRYGYCPTCLLVVVEGLAQEVVGALSWVDISTNSYGTVGGIPVGLLGGDDASRAAVERGQTVLFAAGNGVGNTFDVPQITWGSSMNGPDWNITVGALRRDNERAIFGDGMPVHLSAWGDGNLPSACGRGTVGQCAFGGTSAATPYTAGVFGTVLTEIRQHLGDEMVGQLPGQVIAQGQPIAGSPYLSDGKLTRAELREAVLKTAYPLNTENEPSMFPNPVTVPYTGDENVLFEGYGAATPESAKRAIAVLLGEAPLPVREFEDAFFELDRQIRDFLYGGYDRDGDGTIESYASSQPLGVVPADLQSVDAAIALIQKVAALAAPLVPQHVDGTMSERYYLHRVPATVPGDDTTCLEAETERYMDHEDSGGDLEPCFDSRATSVVAAYRPVGIWASAAPVDAPIPAGSTVYVELYMAGETPSVIRPTGVLMAGDREIAVGTGTPNAVLGTGPGGAGCAALGELCWTKFTLAFDVTRPAVHGEYLTFQVQLLGARSWAFGYEGTHASRVTVVRGEMPATGLEFGTTIAQPAHGATLIEGNQAAMGAYSFPDLGEPDESGPQPTEYRVEVSLNDPSFGDPIEASLDDGTGTWSAPLGNLAAGEYTLYSRARMDTTVSEVASASFSVAAAPVDYRVEWQVVPAGGAAQAGAWRPAAVTGTRYAFEIDTAEYGKGSYDLVVRLMENGSQTAQQVVRLSFK